jgi:hypothetical protein
MSEPVTISVPIGDTGQDYQGGNLLNAIDHVVSYYQNQCSLSNDQIAELLQVYGKGLVEA